MYKNKYLKYKLKYLNLKKEQSGGSVIYESIDKLEDSDLNFEKLISELDKDNNKIMIVCYAPWCIHCKQFMDDDDSNYHKLIKDNEINIYRVDFTSNSDDLNNIVGKFMEFDNILGDISGFPTLVKIDTGINKLSQFKGSRENLSEIKGYFNE